MSDISGAQTDIFDCIAHEERLAATTMTATARRRTLIAAARAERDAGLQQADDSVDDFWRATVDQAIRAFAEAGTPFNADDLREAGVPDPHGMGRSQNAWGPRFLKAKKDGLIVRIGYRAARRTSVHAHEVSVYVGAQHAHLYERRTA